MNNLPGACDAILRSPFEIQSLGSDQFLQINSHPVVESQNLAGRLIERVPQFHA